MNGSLLEHYRFKKESLSKKKLLDRLSEINNGGTKSKKKKQETKK